MRRSLILFEIYFFNICLIFLFFLSIFVQELLALYKYNLDNPYTKLVEEEGEESDGPEPQRWIDPNPQLDSRYDSAPSASSFRGKRSGESDGGGNTEGDSRSLNFGAKGEVEKSGKGEEVDCQINRDRATGLRSRESPDIGENGMTTGWSLPFGSSYPKASLSIITQEFNRLDLLGEGRLTYLTLKSALELREIQTSDSTVRRWLKENDRGG